MKNIMEINDYKAVITFDPDTNQFRGEFIDLNGGADFYAADVQSLRREGEISLKVFLDMCAEGRAESAAGQAPPTASQTRLAPF